MSLETVEGTQTGISAGEFFLWWSEGGAGARSWIYYRADSPIRFIQQPRQIAFESVDREMFQHYIIESSYELKTGNWNPVHTFTAREPNHEWSDVLGKDVDVTFYRIRQGPY